MKIFRSKKNLVKIKNLEKEVAGLEYEITGKTRDSLYNLICSRYGVGLKNQVSENGDRIREIENINLKSQLDDLKLRLCKLEMGK